MSGVNTTAVRTITIEEAERLIEAGTHAIYDLNSDERYAAGHLPGAIHLAAAELRASLPEDHDAALLLYCSSPTCQTAPRAAQVAASLGYTDISVLGVGISGWEDAGRPTETTD